MSLRMEVRWSCLSCLLKGIFSTAVALLSLISSEQVGSEAVSAEEFEELSQKHLDYIYSPGDRNHVSYS